MHMTDALVSPIVGGVMAVLSTGIITRSIKKLNSRIDDKKIPLMAVMGAFIFAAQMINFSIPGTGSSGHIGGGILLAILLGPFAGFLTLVSVLFIQALFFADGGILALGCNIFNLGFYTCFIAYPYIYKKIMKNNIKKKSLYIAVILSSVVGLQLGSLSVVIETMLSGKTQIPFGTFLLMMQPVHLLIGLVEGFITVAVVSFIWKTRPDILDVSVEKTKYKYSFKKVLIILIIASLIIGGGFSLYASSDPDGLEWSLIKSVGTAELDATSDIYDGFSDIQEKTAILPDYTFKSSYGNETTNKLGTSLSGIVGGMITLLFIILITLVIKTISKKKFSKGNKC